MLQPIKIRQTIDSRPQTKAFSLESWVLSLNEFCLSTFDGFSANEFLSNMLVKKYSDGNDEQ